MGGCALGVLLVAAGVQLLRRLQPAIVVFAETEESSRASSEAFLARFEACAASYWTMFHAFEACLGPHDDVKLMLPFEGIFHRTNLYRILACDGPERLIRPISHQSWQAWFRGWGFREAPILPHVFVGLLRFLERFPSEWRTALVTNTLWLSYKGRPIAHASCWV